MFSLKRLILLSSVPVCLFAQPDTSVAIDMDVLSADDLNPELLLNDRTITAASRLPQDVRDIPFTGYVITHEQIRQRGYATLVDVMKDLPGVKVSQPGSALHGETFLMRGLFGNYYVKILVDDLPIQPSATSGMPIGAQLPVAQAERIEVLYGPAAAIYGADAMAGVINIVTKKADKPYFLDADLAARIPGHFKFDVTLAGKFARKNRIWNFMVYGGIYQFDNLLITGQEYAGVYNPQNYVLDGDTDYQNSPFYEGTATQPAFSLIPDQSEKFGLRFGNQKFSFGFDYGRRKTHSAIGSNPLYKTYHDPNAQFGEQIIRGFLSYKFNAGQWYAQTNVQFLWYELDATSNYLTVENPFELAGPFYSYAASSDLYIEQLFSRKLGPYWSVLSGGTFQISGNFPQFDLYTEPFDYSSYRPFATAAPQGLEFLDVLGIGPFNFYNAGGLLEFDYKRERFNALVGLRLDYREFFGLALSPRIGLVYKTGENSRLRFTASTAFRPPSSYLINSGIELFALTDSTAIALPRPNNNLGAEELINLGIGWLWDVSADHSLDVSAFYYRNSNLITRTSTSLAGIESYYGFVNDANSSASLAGVQLVDRYAFKIGSVQFNSTASIQLATGMEVLPFDRGRLNRFREQPLFTGKWLLEVNPIPSIYASLRTSVFSNWITRSTALAELEELLTVDGYYVLDLQLRYSFDEGKDVYIQVNNLTNNAFYGIGATGGVGVLNERVVFEDLIFNPQMLRFIRLGVRINI
jgi:outer membrane cobalamin receptor